MANTMLEGSAISAFCGGVAVMIAAGIQVDEAVYMLADETECRTEYHETDKGTQKVEIFKQK